MANGSDRGTLSFITCVLFFSCLSLEFSSASPQTGVELSGRLVKTLVRIRRQACAYGTYEHEGRTCCMCGIGQRLKTHCRASQNDGECELCDSGTYSSNYTSQLSCEPCTSCQHPNANLEVDEPCTPGRNTKCRCKKDHYCSSGTGTCLLCPPCRKCGSEGVRVACTATHDAVCNDKTEGGNGGTIAAAIIVPVSLLAIIGVAVWYCRRKRLKDSVPRVTSQDQCHATEVELQPLNDLQTRHLPDIAALLGWKDMQDVAMRSGMTRVDIDSCKRGHPTDSKEQTLELLSEWVEREGKGGAEKLVRLLLKTNRKEKAEKVTEILKSASTAPSAPPV